MNDRLANARAITKQLVCDNFRQEVPSDIMSGVDVEQVGMNIHVIFGDSRSNVLEIYECLTLLRTTTTTTPVIT